MNDNTKLPAKPQPKPKPGMVKVVRALYNYTARYPDELSFEEGDVLYVFDRSDPEWWKATCGSKKGLIPRNYVETKSDEIVDPLHEAARRGNLSFLKECLIFETKLDEIVDPLHEAARRGNLSFLKECLIFETKSDEIVDPLHEAARRGNLSFLKECLIFETKSDEIVDPLHEAARRGNLSFLKECLSQKVSPTGLDAMGNTPLYWASHAGHLDCLMCLLSLTDPPLNAQNHFGDTPLHGASAKGHYTIVEALLKAGADPSIVNTNGETPEMLSRNLNIKNLLQKQKLRCQESFQSGVNPEEYEGDSD